jgi:hypothetical protein
MRRGEAAAVLLLQGVPMQPAEAEAALDRIEATGRVERDPGGLRVCVERVVEPVRAYGFMPRIHPRPTAAHSEDTTQHGSTQKGTRETGGHE